MPWISLGGLVNFIYRFYWVGELPKKLLLRILSIVLFSLEEESVELKDGFEAALDLAVRFLGMLGAEYKD